MESNQPKHSYLATDLDGTLIPLQVREAVRGGLSVDEAERRLEASTEALRRFHQAIQPTPGQPRLRMAFLTGRHLESVGDAIGQFDLPLPEWILCDVGSSIYHRQAGDVAGRSPAGDVVTDGFERLQAYDDELSRITGDIDADDLRRRLQAIDGIRLQEPEKQARFKLSFYADQHELEQRVAAIREFLDQQDLPFGIVHSVDPFNGDGLIDVMPRGVTKAHALHWWIQHFGIDSDQIAFAGDSGNDLAALISGIPAVVVGNADRSLASRVLRHHRESGWEGRLFLADDHSTAGVWQGCRWFGLVGRDGSDPTIGSDATTCPSSLEIDRLHGHLGASLIHRDTTRFVVFAPSHQEVEVLLVDQGDQPMSTHRLRRTDVGYHVGLVNECPAGTRYRYRLSGETVVPDPASRFQPDGVHGPSQVVDRRHAWAHRCADSIGRDDLIIYELHLGTFTDAGTYQAAIDRLDELVELGVNAIEIMPVAACGGRWNWGYDGVDWFAPMADYGTPDQFRDFVDAAHGKGLAVILDVVYNHFGPEGNYLHPLGGYISAKHHTVWGDAPNFDQPPTDREVRRFAIANAIHWLDEYRIDGLRVDAIHCIADDSENHWVAELSEAVRKWGDSKGRKPSLIAESNIYDPQMLIPRSQGGMNFDAQWCDDFLHSVFAVLRPGEQLSQRTYHAESDLRQVMSQGYVFEGTVRSPRQRTEPGARVDTAGLVYSIQNHDFIGNHPLGQRLHTIAGMSAQRAAAALLILSPAIPMLFMGEEFACPNPFSFFVDFGDDHLRQSVVEGRRREYPQHDWSAGHLPTDPAAMESSKIGPRSAGSESMWRWYRDLIAMRKQLQQAACFGDDCYDVLAGPKNVFVMRYSNDKVAVTIQVCLAGQVSAAVLQCRDGESTVMDSMADQYREETDSAADQEHAAASRALITARGLADG
ncbi:malto-oligosyltrehalose trehalohydrolase [Crateriforma spongiae]|uniref:malto-oligosyltrehalose trehalohydrolase n=1 Tax=Crateriforma spongiae TaxID=2724528 RepID=UPI0014488F4C|nr:malto-oligosyltrehalose trehalohydrolase [Crateriforma spongiae]